MSAKKRRTGASSRASRAGGKVDPTAARTISERAARALDTGDYSRAREQFEQALSADPDCTAARAGLAEALASSHQHDAARAELDALLDQRPRTADTAHAAGITWERLGKPADAARCFAAACRRSPERFDLQVAAARALERANQVDEAREALGRARALGGDAELEILEARLDRRAGAHATAAERLRRVLGTELPEALRITASYEYAQVLDRLGEFADAFEALRSAKDLQARHPDFAAVLDRARRLEAMQRATCLGLTSGHVQQWAAEPSLRTPRRLAILTGHPRSGTTLLEQVLDGHGELVSADESTAFVDVVAVPLSRGASTATSSLDALHAATRSQLEACRKDYWSKSQAFLGAPIDSRMLLDKNPELTPLLPFVHRAFPEARVLTMLRDPRDVVLSCYFQELPLNPISVHWLDVHRAVQHYAWIAMAWRTLRAVLPGDRWIEVRYEDTVDDLEAVTRRALDFLGLDWQPEVLAFTERAKDRAIDNPSYEAVTRPVHRGAVGRWRNYATWLEPHLTGLDKALTSFGYG